MDLSNDLISKFVKITNDNSKKNESKEATVYGTTVEYDNQMYVKIDGSDLLTPITTTADIKPNERVTIMIKDHNATVTGNITSPSASSTEVKKVTQDVEALGNEITEVEILIADRVSTKELDAEVARIDELIAGRATVEDLTATNAVVSNLQATKADIDDLTALDAKIEDLDATYATIQQLDATKADIQVLDAEVADINTLVNGNLTSDNILSLHLTAQNTTVDNAFIKDAMIDGVTANKIMSGTIDTNNVTIQSTDGSMLLQGTLLQMKDENGKVRIQIGKDGGGNFTFVLYDANGTGVLIDEEGIKSSDAIADGLIVDAKVAENANIAGSKLDIASVITEVNNDNSTTIKSNKIYLDEQGQSLEVAFNSMVTKTDELEESVTSNTTQINVANGNINTLVAENTSRKEEIKNLDGEIESVNSTLSSKYSSLEQSLDGFKTSVSSTYATKESVTDLNNNLSTNYSTTSQMNSAIDQKANQITSSVSETYATKTTVNDLSNNLSTNYSTTAAMNSAINQKANEITSSVSSTYATKTELANLPVNGNVNLLRRSSDFGDPTIWRQEIAELTTLKYRGCIIWQTPHQWADYGYVVSDLVNRGVIETNVNYTFSCYIRSTSASYTPTIGFYGNDEYHSGHGTFCGTATTSWQRISVTFYWWDIASAEYTIRFEATTSSTDGSCIQVAGMKLEKGDKATDWTPSPEDGTEAENRWLFEKYISTLTPDSSMTTYPTFKDILPGALVSSQLVEKLTHLADYGSCYLGKLTASFYFEEDSTQTKTVYTDDNGTWYLNGATIGHTPSVVATSITFNFKKGWNKLTVLWLEGGGEDGVTIEGGITGYSRMNAYNVGNIDETGMYLNYEMSTGYATKSEVNQTTTDLTVKFTESGGYNLLRNGHGDKSTQYWVDNGGGLFRYSNAGGNATGNFLATTMPIGIRYQEWVRLKANTHYVYQAKIYANGTFTGRSDIPLHWWFSWTGEDSNVGDVLVTFIDWDTTYPTADVWKMLYIHFVTPNANVYMKPFFYGMDSSLTQFYMTEIMLSESRTPQPWSPHPSEIYEGITNIDKDGIQVYRSDYNGYTHMAPSGFFVNCNGTDVISATSNGLYVQGNITSGSNISGASITGSTFNSTNDVFQVLSDGTVETSFLAVNNAVSTNKLNVNDIENAAYPKVMYETTTVYISPNGGINSEEFYDGAQFTSIASMLSVAPRNLNGYTLTIKLKEDVYENAAFTWFHSGQVNFEMQGNTLFGYFYGYGASMCYRLYGYTSGSADAWGHIRPNAGRNLGSYYYAVLFQYCQFAVNYISVYPSASSGSNSGGIGAHRGATGVVFSARACGDLRYLVRAEHAARVHVNSSEGVANNSTFCATTGGIITLNSSNSQAGRSTTGNPYWAGNGGIIMADQVLGMDNVTFGNTAQAGSSSSSGSTTRTVTETIKASSADTYRSTVYNNWKGDSTVRQGDYGYGDCQGCWFFGNNLYNVMNSGTVTKVIIRMQRQAGGVNAAQTLTVKSHNYTTKPSGAPTYADTIGTCSCAVGSYVDLVITDSTTINKLKACKGLGLSIGSTSSPYVVCSGSCSVIITYTTTS